MSRKGADDAFASALQSAMFSATAPRPKSMTELTEEVALMVLVEVVEDELWETVVVALSQAPLSDEQWSPQTADLSCYVDIGGTLRILSADEEQQQQQLETEDQEEVVDGDFSDDGGEDSPTARSHQSLRRVCAVVAEIEEPPVRVPFDVTVASSSASSSGETFEDDDFDENGQEGDEFVVEEKEAVASDPLQAVAERARQVLAYERRLLCGYEEAATSTTSKRLRRESFAEVDATPTVRELISRRAMVRCVTLPPVDAVDEVVSDEEEGLWLEPRAIIKVVRLKGVDYATVDLAARALAELPVDPTLPEARAAAELAKLALHERQASDNLEVWLKRRHNVRLVAASSQRAAMADVATDIFRAKCGVLPHAAGSLGEDGDFGPLFGSSVAVKTTSDYEVSARNADALWDDDAAAAFVETYEAYLMFDAAAAVALRLCMPKTLACLLVCAARSPPVAALVAAFDAVLSSTDAPALMRRSPFFQSRRANAVKQLFKPATDRYLNRHAPLCALLLRAAAVHTHYLAKGFGDVIPEVFADLA